MTDVGMQGVDAEFPRSNFEAWGAVQDNGA